MQVFLWHVHNAEYAGIGQIEAEHQLAGIFRLAFDRKRHFIFVFRDIVGADIDLDVDRGLLLLRRQRARGVRIIERKVLGVLRQHVQLGRRGRLGRRAVAVGHGVSPGTWLSERHRFCASIRSSAKENALVGRVAIIAAARSTRTTIASCPPRRAETIGRRGKYRPLGWIVYSKLLNMRDFPPGSGFPLAPKTRYTSPGAGRREPISTHMVSHVKKPQLR